MSGGDNTSARAVDIRIAGQIASMVDMIVGVQVVLSADAIQSIFLNAAEANLEEALAVVAKRIRDWEVDASENRGVLTNG